MRTHLSKIENYPAFLEACWQEHLKPKAEDAPTVISLFAGCGGSSLGYASDVALQKVEDFERAPKIGFQFTER
jgi:hypothetical protein